MTEHRFHQKKEFVVAVVGATGAVGREMLKTLEARKFPISKLLCLASKRSAGLLLPFHHQTSEGAPYSHTCVVSELNETSFEGVDIALFSAGASVSREYAPLAAKAGALVIDNSSAWRMDNDVPLVVPEVNPEALKDIPKGIIANPNCSTIQLCVALKPLHDANTLTRIIISTYQAVSGKGQAAVEEMKQEAKAALSHQSDFVRTVFPAPMAFNVLSDWKAGEDDYSEEEWKLVRETRKILNEPGLRISPTTVRVPVENGHSESVNLEFKTPLSPTEAKDLLRHAPGVKLMEDSYLPGNTPYPLMASGKDDVFVGRIRKDLGNDSGLALFIVADNLRKGAALNAVQIAEYLIKN